MKTVFVHFGKWISVERWSVFNDIAYIYIFPPQNNRPNDFGQQPPGCTYKRLTLLFLVISGSFTAIDEPCLRVPHPEDNTVPALGKLAPPAIINIGIDLFQGFTGRKCATAPSVDPFGIFCRAIKPLTPHVGQRPKMPGIPLQSG